MEKNPKPALNVEVPEFQKYHVGTKIHCYTIVTYLQGGSYGSVYQAEKESNSTQYALKAINKKDVSQSELARLKIEKDIMAKINQENIVQLYEFIDDPNYTDYFMVLDFCEGAD